MFCQMTCIHCQVVDLPNLMEEQGIPEPYTLFGNPYKLKLQVSVVKETLYFRLFTLTSQKAHNST